VFHRQSGGDRGEKITPMERRAQASGAPGDAIALAPTRALPDRRKKPIVRTDEAAAVGLDDDRVALAADAGVDYSKKDAAPRVLRTECEKKVGGRLNAEIGRVVQGVDDRDARRALGENCFDLPDVQIAGAEVGEKDDQAALAAFFSSLFCSAFGALFFFFSSGLGSGVSSGRSISMTSASGALSPFLKPVLRMRRYPPLRLA
jgi:hypothetical protein